MAARRKNGAFVSASVTEAARRQLMTPVSCWELQWCTPDCVAPGSTLKVYKWVKTDKLQQFSDDEGEADDPLAPLPDEPEAAEGEEEEQEDDVPKSESVVQSRDVSEPRLPDIVTAPPSPKPHPLSMSLVPEPDGEEDETMDDTNQAQLTLDPLGAPTDPTLDTLDPEMDAAISDEHLDALAMGAISGQASFDLSGDLEGAEDIIASLDPLTNQLANFDENITEG